MMTVKSLGSGKVVQAFNPRRLRQGDIWIQGQPGTKQVLDPGMVVCTFNPRSHRQADLSVQVQPSIVQVPCREKLKPRHGSTSL